MYKLLDGVKAIEVTAYWPDAVGQYLGDLGAEVIKVEPPGYGTLTRGIGGHDGLQSAQFSHWNRNKKSLALDLKAPEGRDVFLELASKVDFVIDGLRAGALESFGVGYEALKRVNPGIIYVTISGWGHSGPYQRLGTHGAGFDAYAALQPPDIRPDGLPQDPHAPFGDAHHGTISATLNAALGALAAYIQRTNTGHGAHIDVAQADGAVTSTFDRVYYQLNLGYNPYEGRPASTRYQYYPTKDDNVVFFMCTERKFWNNFCHAVGRPDLAEEGERNEFTQQGSLGDEAERQVLAKIMRTKTRAEWIEFFIEHNGVGAPVNSVADLVADPQFQARDMVTEYRDAERGTIKAVSSAIKVGGSKFEISRAPEIGEHTDEVLKEFGLADRIGALRQKGVIA